MKILITCTLYPPYVLGGAEISTAMLAEGLASFGNEVSVLTIGATYSEDVVNGITIYRIKNKNIYWRYPQRENPLIKKSIWHLIDSCDILYKSDVYKIMDELKPDIVHSGNLCGLSTIVWKCAKNRGIPVVHTLRDYYLLCPYQTMCKNGTPCKTQCRLCKGYSAYKKKMSQNVDAVIGISNFILDKHLEHGLFKNAQIKRVIANSIETEYKGDRIRKNNVIGYLGRISPEKGIELLIDAFLKSHNENKTLLIAGDGNADYVKKLTDKFKNSQINFIGKVNSDSFLQTIDLLVIPSLWNEPFGRVVIEAYSQHIPVFMANNGGLQDLDYEGIGWKFDTSNEQQLVSLLNQFFENDIIVKEETFELIKDQYSQKHIIEAYIDIYKDILR